MFAAALAAFIATFNETFLNVGFTNIMADFNIGVSTVQWLATAYMLGAAVMTPTAGFFIRRFNTKPLYLAMTLTWIVGGARVDRHPRDHASPRDHLPSARHAGDEAHAGRHLRPVPERYDSSGPPHVRRQADLRRTFVGPQQQAGELRLRRRRARLIGDSVPAFTTPYALLAHNDSTEFGTDVAVVLDRPIASIATKSVITVNVNDDLGHISSMLADKHLKKAPVVADDGTVVGIINRSDINRYLVSTFVAPVPST